MARKTAIRITNAEVSAAEARSDARKDAPAAPKPAGLLPSLAEMRAKRGQMAERELLARAKSAARLELRGASFSADDRLDVAARIVADVLTETGGAMPRSESPRVTLTALCDRAKTARRSIERQRARDDAEAKERRAVEALAPAAIGADHTPARHVAIIGRANVAAAKRAASAICAELGLPSDETAPHWAVFYVWTRGESPEVCAAELGATWGAFRVRMSRGAKFVRGFYSAPELVSRLTLGARHDAATDALVYVLTDDSQEAHARTRMLSDVASAPHWREGTAHGAAPERPSGAQDARAACKVSKCKVRPKRERTRAIGDRAAHTAAALAKLGRAHAQDAARRGQRERTAPRRSTLASAKTSG